MFTFKRFEIDDSACAMKVGTDSVLLGAWTAIDAAPGATLRVLDAGAGSGILSLMVAQRCAEAGVDSTIEAVEIDADAARCAAANISRSPWPQCAHVVETDLLAYKPTAGVDLLISNPPYFSGGLVSPQSARALARHGATDADTDGTLTPRSLVAYAARVLTADGTMAMITPADDADAILFAAEMHRLCLWRRCRVSTAEGKPPSRILWQFARHQRPVQETALAIRSNACRQLTSGFYLY